MSIVATAMMVVVTGKERREGARTAGLPDAYNTHIDNFLNGY